MSERFTLDVRMDMPKLLIDNYTNEKYNLLMVNDIERIVDLLNEQQAIIQSLKEENEKLRKELDNFKPVMFQDVRKGTVILYSKGD